MESQLLSLSLCFFPVSGGKGRLRVNPLGFFLPCLHARVRARIRTHTHANIHTGVEIIKGEKEVVMIEDYKEKGRLSGRYNLASVLIGMYVRTLVLCVCVVSWFVWVGLRARVPCLLVSVCPCACVAYMCVRAACMCVCVRRMVVCVYSVSVCVCLSGGLTYRGLEGEGTAVWALQPRVRVDRYVRLVAWGRAGQNTRIHAFFFSFFGIFRSEIAPKTSCRLRMFIRPSPSNPHTHTCAHAHAYSIAHIPTRTHTDKPMLLLGRKVDFRIYALIASTEPFIAFMYNVFMARVSPEKYGRMFLFILLPP